MKPNSITLSKNCEIATKCSVKYTWIFTFLNQNYHQSVKISSKAWIKQKKSMKTIFPISQFSYFSHFILKLRNKQQLKLLVLYFFKVAIVSFCPFGPEQTRTYTNRLNKTTLSVSGKTCFSFLSASCRYQTLVTNTNYQIHIFF